MYPNSITGGAEVHMAVVVGLAVLAIAALVIAIYNLVKKKNKDGLLVQTSSKLGRPTDYTLDNTAYKTGNIMMSPAQLANYYNVT